MEKNIDLMKISIVTINYNNYLGLERTLKSVQAQKNATYESVVIDGGSNDKSTDVIKNYKSIITSSVSEADNGVYQAMNKGIKIAKGEYLLFLNSGDYFYDDTSLSKILKELDGTDLIAFNINMYNSKINIIYKHPEKLSSYYLFDETLAHQSVLIKRDLFKKYGLYDENLLVVSDWKFFLKAAISGCTYKNHDQIITKFEYGGISSTAEGVRIRKKEREVVLKEDYAFFYDDYKLLKKQKELLSINRFKLLLEIEKKYLGRKFLSIVLRGTVYLFSKKKLKNILNSNDS
ncbi:glycosyltransferase family 2 protein [Polaribacter sp.]|uniref:glycosyltransferase family 2 protein n=1 Tax=Polaribacter sp. TaxID=1920175 RepID=UPI003F4AEF52